MVQLVMLVKKVEVNPVNPIVNLRHTKDIDNSCRKPSKHPMTCYPCFGLLRKLLNHKPLSLNLMEHPSHHHLFLSWSPSHLFHHATTNKNITSKKMNPLLCRLHSYSKISLNYAHLQICEPMCDIWYIYTYCKSLLISLQTSGSPQLLVWDSHQGERNLSSRYEQEVQVRTFPSWVVGLGEKH